MNMNSRPLVFFTLCWVLGSAAGAGLLVPGIMLAGGALAVLLFAQILLHRSTWLLAAACLVAFAGAAAERGWADKHNVSALPPPDQEAAAPGSSAAYSVEVSGTIVSAVEVDGDRAQFKVRVHDAAVAGESEPRKLSELLLVNVKLAEQPDQAIAAGWRRGSHIVINGEISEPAAATNFGGFDYRSYLLSQRIHWLLKANGISSVQISPGPRLSKASLLSRIDEFRGSLGSRMDGLFPADQAGYMKGLVLGIREDLDPEQFRQFSQLGLTHILAVSGLHVAVFLYVLGGLLRLLRLTRERMLLIMIAAVPFYVLLAGGAPSIMRAGIMAMLGLFAARLNKLKDGLHLLSAAALLMLVWDPYLLEDVGFQLSFLVTAGLILGVQPVRKLLPRGKRSKALFDLIAVTVVAQAVSFPLTIYYFNQIHLLSLLANFILVPFISFIVMPLGGAALVLDSLWHAGAAWLGSVASVANRLSFGVVLQLSGFQQLRFIIGSPPFGWVLYMYASIGLCLSLLHRRGLQPIFGKSSKQPDNDTRPMGGKQWVEEDVTQPLGSLLPNRAEASLGASGSRQPIQSTGRIIISVLLCLALIAPILWAYYPKWNNNDAYVSFLDVGQGDSILIRTAHGKHILIDGGGSVSFRKKGEEWKDRDDPFEVGRKVLVPLLQKRGVQQIDLLVMTHLDSDHIKGLRAVIDNIPVKGMLWNGTFKRSDDAVSMLGAAVDKGIPMYRSEAGQSWVIDDGATISLIGGNRDSESDTIPLVEEQNGQSVAMIVELYGRSFLLTGDADAAEERAILSRISESGGALLEQPASAAIGEHEENQAINKTKSNVIDVMKVSHHGSKTSSTPEWLAYWQPHTAVISVGRNNTYGHPNGEVMERLTAAGADVKRTDLNGEIEYRITADSQLFARQMLAGWP